MPDTTGLERMEHKLEQMWGGAKPFGMGDKSMLEMDDVNRWTFDKRQSELLIAWRMLHDALVAADNRVPRFKRVKDSQTGEWKSERVWVDNFKWMMDLDYWVKTNQLSIEQNARIMHLRWTQAQSAIAHEEHELGFFDRLLGRGE
jgi:hypothetical protein